MKEQLRRASIYSRVLKHRIDPRQSVVGVVFLVLLYLQGAGFDADSGSPALSKARHYVLVLLRHVRQINRMAFWKCLVLPKSQRNAGNIQDHHSELLMIARDSLQGGSASRADIVAAMDVLHEVVARMNAMFAAARVTGHDEPEESWAIDRYTCAALLPTLAEQLNNFWVQLRKTTDHTGPHL